MTQPATFAERMTLFFSRFLVWAGVGAGLGGLLIIAILTWGGWPEAHYGAIITILGKLAFGAGVVMTLVVIFIGLGGPVRKLKAAIWKASIETESD